MGTASFQMTANLTGHKGKVANLNWSPHFEDVLASTGDDGTIRVWNVQSKMCKVLVGHDDNTRAVAWNHEIPWILVSGSWDCSIRVWDIRTCSTIYIMNHHIADIYGIDSHPARPFIYTSCSRDTTIRQWALNGFIHSIKLRLVL